MQSKGTCHGSQSIELFFRQQLSDVEQSKFETHLESCIVCRDALEALAAIADDWATARDSLGSNPTPLPVFDDTGTSGRLPADLETGNDPDCVSDESLTRPDSVLNFLTPSDDPRMMGRLGTYEIVGIVGQGGMGVVFKGLDPALNRYVAIKALAPHLAASGAARRRFAREAKAAAAITHENVIAIHGVSEWNGLPYLVMPYIRGESLQKRIDLHGPRNTQEILRVGMQIAAGLAAAHVQGLVHRDIKPANILLEEGVERLKITDFGLARTVDDASMTRTGVIAGTPMYMSPEQARGEAIDHRSDLFSLGSVLYAMATGRPPFRAETSYGILRRITDTEPRPICEINPDLPAWLENIIQRLLSKTLEMRFANAQEVALLFEQCLAHQQQPQVIPLPHTCRKKPRGLTRGSALLLGFACIFAILPLLPFVRDLTTLKFLYEVPTASEVTEVSQHETARGDLDRANPNIKHVDPMDGLSGQIPKTTSGETSVPSTPVATDSNWDQSAVQLNAIQQEFESLNKRVESLWDTPE